MPTKKKVNLKDRDKGREQLSEWIGIEQSPNWSNGAPIPSVSFLFIF